MSSNLEWFKDTIRKNNILQEPSTITMTTAISSYLDKAVISLDDILIGYVKEEDENNKMMMETNSLFLAAK